MVIPSKHVTFSSYSKLMTRLLGGERISTMSSRLDATPKCDGQRDIVTIIDSGGLHDSLWVKFVIGD